MAEYRPYRISNRAAQARLKRSQADRRDKFSRPRPADQLAGDAIRRLAIGLFAAARAARYSAGFMRRGHGSCGGRAGTAQPSSNRCGNYVRARRDIRF